MSLKDLADKVIQDEVRRAMTQKLTTTEEGMAQFVQGVFMQFNSSYMNLTYDDFCTKLNLRDDFYAREKFTQFGIAARALSNLSIDLLLKLVVSE